MLDFRLWIMKELIYKLFKLPLVAIICYPILGFRLGTERLVLSVHTERSRSGVEVSRSLDFGLLRLKMTELALRVKEDACIPLFPVITCEI